MTINISINYYLESTSIVINGAMTNTMTTSCMTTEIPPQIFAINYSL